MANPKDGVLTLYKTTEENKTFGFDFSGEGIVRDGAVLSAPQVFIAKHVDEDDDPTLPTVGVPQVVAADFTDSDGKKIKAGKGVKVRIAGGQAGKFTVACRVTATLDGADTLESGGTLVVTTTIT